LLACWGSVWPGEGLSLKYRLSPPFHISSFCRTVLAALLLGSHEDCSHYALSVDTMDSNRLGEALSPTDWATCSALYRRSASMLIRLEEIEGSFLLLITSKWRVQDGDCPSINQVSAVVQDWSSVDDVQIVHYPYVAWIGRLVMKCGCFVAMAHNRLGEALSSHG